VLLLVTFTAAALPLMVSLVVADSVLVVRPTSHELPLAASAVPWEPSTAPPSTTAPPVSNARRDDRDFSASSVGFLSMTIS